MPDVALEMDQAAGLRRLFRAPAARAVAFVSGRDACGRTKLLLRTAAALAKAGEGVVIIDENSGKENVHSAFGMKVRRDLLDLVNGACSIEGVVQPIAPRLSVIAAARFASAEGQFNASTAEKLDAVLRQLQEGCSYVLIDCTSRDGQPLSSLASAAPHMAVVVAAQGSGITRAYALIKLLAIERGRAGFHIAITRPRSEQEALSIFHNMRQTAREHLGVRLDYLGCVRDPAVDHVAEALQSRLPLASEGGDHGGFLPVAGALRPLAAGAKRLESVL
ncbi:MAG: hypothetical protein K9K30_02795 [Burkholderiaceae bacterium]|nr:hypothetical protein [Sulfuritalea sp.]MCF8174146.1 hypothetical protein [Burkholderiaceae bacterium]MCF8184618.1 hypothetical protein [Polynucleobacter sp.]